jgi:hypothetical protein
MSKVWDDKEEKMLYYQSITNILHAVNEFIHKVYVTGGFDRLYICRIKEILKYISDYDHPTLLKERISDNMNYYIEKHDDPTCYDRYVKDDYVYLRGRCDIIAHECRYRMDNIYTDDIDDFYYYLKEYIELRLLIFAHENDLNVQLDKHHSVKLPSPGMDPRYESYMKNKYKL